jgi:hypothetical protein
MMHHIILVSAFTHGLNNEGLYSWILFAGSFERKPCGFFMPIPAYMYNFFDGIQHEITAGFL